MPALAKILLVFAAILLLTRVRVHLGASLVLGGCGLVVWAGMPVATVPLVLWDAVCRADLWLLIAITAMIVEVGRFMTVERNADALLRATRRWGGRHGRACSLMALPAVIGLIPMPAGALFSAPFVQQAFAGRGGEGASKAGINYWFRHIWEYWWPLYPGVMLTMSIFDIELLPFIGVQLFFTPLAVGVGYWFLVRPHVRALADDRTSAPDVPARVWITVLPLIVVLGSLFLFPLVMHEMWPAMDAQIRKLLAVLLGLVLAVVVITVEEMRNGTRRMFSTILARKSRTVLISLAGVLVFKSLLEASGLLPRAGDELLAARIPLEAAVAVLPFLAGVVTGIAVGFAGVAFPLVVGLLAGDGHSLSPLATLVLAYGFGYMGMMLSPVHLCLLVSRDYFACPVSGVYRRILPCVFTVMLGTIVVHIALRLLGL